MSSSAITGPILSDVRRAPAGTAAAPSFAFNDSTGTGVYLVSAGVLGLSTNGVQRVVVDASGNVGIGTAPSTWTNSKAIQLGTTGGAAFFNNSPANAWMLSNASYDGTNFRYVNSSFATAYAKNNGVGDHRWYIAPSGTAGNAITFTQAMTLDASGNLLVGTTSADPSTSLVNGTAIGGIGYLSANRVGNTWGYIGRSSTTGTILQFRYGGADVGYISTNGSTITFSGNALSDERWKENIKPIDNALSAVMSTEFVSFEYKENKKPSAGVVAQQLQQVAGLGAFVSDGAEESDYKAVDYNAIVGYLGKAIQEQQAQIEKQSQALEALKAEVAALKAP